MLNDRQLMRMFEKIERFQQQMEQRIFQKVGELADVTLYETADRLYEIPANGYRPVEEGQEWGAECGFGWFRGSYTVPETLDGRELFLYPKLGGGETLLYVDGKPYGIFARKHQTSAAGHHYCDRIRAAAKAGETIRIDMEAFAGRYVRGTQPFQEKERWAGAHRFTYRSVDVCVKDALMYDCYFDLRTVNMLLRAQKDDTYRRAEIMNVMEEVHKAIYYAFDDVDEERFRAGVERTRELLAPVLAQKNADSAPVAGLVGHSHMDTAWLWTLDDTIKKCARTYSNQLNLMDRYPEYRFVQSSAYHSYMLLEHYPELFGRIAERVREGRYEPNGGVWVECDCNITSGESMVRQFLWGQRFTRQYFGYTSDAFWLPDTFGYSPSIPQIMKGCSVDYFLTTKMSWNDTNRFPYDTFYWQGMDGTRVFTHLNTSSSEPDPIYLSEQLNGGGKGGFPVRVKTVNKRRLIAYGHGDGGGGPQFEMIETARRLADVDGCPKTKTVSVSAFMRELEENAHEAPIYAKELYLELHRGTLTNQHEIKRNNRKAEVGIHDLEFLTVADAVQKGEAADEAPIRPLLNHVLVNQFHDILPGTCIPEAHEMCKQQMRDTLAALEERIHTALETDGTADTVTLVNPLSFERTDAVYLTLPAGKRVAGGYAQQRVTDLSGQALTAVAGLVQQPFAAMPLSLEAGEPKGASPFVYDGKTLTTPFAVMTFAENGGIDSFVDRRCGRELRGEGYPLNTFLFAEDVSLGWDNWDIDADIQLKFRDCAVLLSREVAADGPVELRLRSRYRISDKTELEQDMIVYADSPLVKFDTVLHWNDDHRFLKTAFDTNLFADTARFEMQFGHIKRPTTRSTDEELAKFEVVNHKYTDLSETRYGAAILNDCKYGISVLDGQMRLSLHKGGVRPDYTGDHGDHRCVYAFLPHDGGFSAEAVVRPAYELNDPPIALAGGCSFEPLLTVDAGNIVVETIKPCEDGGRAYIARLYDAEGTTTLATLRFAKPPKAVTVTNMLEEDEEALDSAERYSLSFRPFQIRTIKVEY